jgi:hypothetical protein
MVSDDQNVREFPSPPAHIRTKGQLAWYLRELATLIENDKTEIRPTAIMTVLSNGSEAEVLHVGFKSSCQLTKAGHAAINLNKGIHSGE